MFFKNIKSLFKDLFNFLTGKERRLGFELSFFTSGIIVLIILCMGAYINAAMNALSEKVNVQNENTKISLSASLLNVIEGDIKNDNFSAIRPKIDHLLTNKMLAYLIIVDKNNNKVVYTTLNNNPFRFVEGALKPQKNIDPSLKRSQYLKSERSHYTIYIGFYTDSIFKENFDKLVKQTPYLVFAFVLMGLLISVILARRIASPLNSLIQATGEFEQGDLSNRVSKTSYLEINELVTSYNSMADALQRLYSSMEHKVQERTKQLEVAYQELQNTQAMMVHSEKMKSLGELVAGIMHEINNPVNFIYGNLSHLNNYSADLINIIDTYAKYEKDLKPEELKEIQNLKQELDYEFLKSDLPDLIRSCREGTERTRNIILDLKDFSRMEEVALTNVDIPKEIDTTLNILHNKFKHKITVHKEYEENLPKLEAYGGQINQVIMNILDNAAYAIESKDHGDVWIRIKTVDNSVIMEFEDNGKGMDAVTMDKIFNPFFTTKPVGQGTGLGMAISYKVIKNHQGTISVESEVGKGTKFTVKLPVSREKEPDLIKENKQEEVNELEIIE